MGRTTTGDNEGKARGGKTVPARLALFAAHHMSGMKPAEAALAAGYSPSYAKNQIGRIVEAARDAGLIVSPKVIEDAVAILEEALPDVARKLAAVAKGEEEPTHDDQLDWVRELWDRARGRAGQKIDVTTAGQAIIPTVFRPAAPGETPPDDEEPSE